MYTEDELQEAWQEVIAAAQRDGAGYIAYRQAHRTNDADQIKQASDYLDKIREHDGYYVRRFYALLCGAAGEYLATLEGIDY